MLSIKLIVQIKKKTHARTRARPRALFYWILPKLCNQKGKEIKNLNDDEKKEWVNKPNETMMLQSAVVVLQSCTLQRLCHLARH